MIDSQQSEPQTAWRMIRARDKAEPTYGFANLALLAKYHSELKGVDFGLVKQAFNNGKWEKMPHEFNKNNHKLVTILKFPSIPILGPASKYAVPKTSES